MIQSMFHRDQNKSDGMHSVWICREGDWQLVVIDDFLPVLKEDDSEKLAFMSHTSKEDELPEIWPSLVEKAYAKSLGSYAKILEADFPTILRDLTGAPCTILAIDDSKQLRDEIEDALKKGQFVAACAKDAGVGESKSNQIGI